MEERKFPLLFSPYDVRDYAINADTNFPKEFSLGTVTIKDQGSVGSCVAHALSSIVEYHNKRQEGTNIIFSTDFIYGYRPKGYYIGEGMYLREALKTITKCGDVPEFILKGNHEYDEAMKIVEQNLEELKDKAYIHRISSYVKLNTVDEIKTALMKYGYVALAICWHKRVKIIDGIYTPQSNETSGGHALVIYGWNEKGWLVQNSWGEDWGNKGTFVLPYNIEIEEAWSVVDEIVHGQEIIKPKKNIFIKLFYRIINFFINLCK